MDKKTNPNSCILDSRFIYHLLSFRDLSPPPSSSFNHSFPVFSPGLYTLYFANCLRETSVSMTVSTERYNINSDGVKEFLSVEQTSLPIVLAILFVTYLCLTYFWVYTFLTSNPLIRPLHKVMLGLLVTKDLYLISAEVDKFIIQVTGVQSGFYMWVYLLDWMHVVVLFIVVVLISTGWHFLKPLLQQREQHMLVFVVFLQLFSKFASYLFAENLPPSKLEWGFFLSIDGLCCCAILWITFWSLKFLETSTIEGRHSTAFSDVRVVKVFCFIAILYTALSSAIPFYLRGILGYKDWWVITFAEEIYEFLFLCGILYTFNVIGNSAETIQVDEIELTHLEIGHAA